jgi:hypothetical protein
VRFTAVRANVVEQEHVRRERPFDDLRFALARAVLHMRAFQVLGA